MSRFFVGAKNIQEDLIFIRDKEDIKHISKALRHKEGDILEISDGQNFEYEIELLTVTTEFIEGKILSKKPFQREPKTKITLYQGIPKQGKMENIVQKAVELGVYRIKPMFTERTVVIDKGNFDKKSDRWQKIADEAVKQCRRGIIPKVDNAASLSQVLTEMKENDLNIFFYENETDSLKDIIREAMKKSPKSVGIIIGPEGGFSQAEVEKIKAAGAISSSLGKTILRVETASIAALAIVLYELEQ